MLNYKLSSFERFKSKKRFCFEQMPLINESNTLHNWQFPAASLHVASLKSKTSLKNDAKTYGFGNSHTKHVIRVYQLFYQKLEK